MSTAFRAPRSPSTAPMIVAHRGASHLAPEHTLEAYVEAIASGADAVECDVRLTRDGHLVCVHDRTVNRTSDGRGPVSELDLGRLAELDFSSWHQPPGDTRGMAEDESGPYLAGVVPDRLAGGGVLTLQRLLELVHDAPRPVEVLIETKHPTRYGGLVEKTLVDVLDRFGWTRPDAEGRSRVSVMSFATTALRRVRVLAPEVPTVLLFEWMLPTRRDGSLPSGVPVAGPDVRVLRSDPGYVERSHRRGHPVYVWTVDTADDVRFVRGLGVDAIITNRPDEVLVELGRS
jgi:glycerophosphoryl diester phosphodiesterase